MSLHIVEESFDSARDFVRALDPLDDRWSARLGGGPNWVFRGQRDADWPLIPSAWRQSARVYLDPVRSYWARTLETDQDLRGRVDPEAWDIHLQWLAECTLVRDYLVLSDAIGLHVPGWVDEVAQKASIALLRPEGEGRVGVFEIHNLTAAFALAQHHGIPTRLLDWTNRPRVAAYFAAHDAVENQSDDGDLCVWALDWNGDRLPELEAVSCPSSMIPFLRSQAGHSIFIKNANNHYREHQEWPSMESFLDADTLDAPAIGESEPRVRKLTIPADQAESVLRQLWHYEISKAHLMPTFDNVAQTLRRYVEWEYPAS